MAVARTGISGAELMLAIWPGTLKWDLKIVVGLLLPTLSSNSPARLTFLFSRPYSTADRARCEPASEGFLKCRCEVLHEVAGSE